MCCPGGPCGSSCVMVSLAAREGTGGGCSAAPAAWHILQLNTRGCYSCMLSWRTVGGLWLRMASLLLHECYQHKGLVVQQHVCVNVGSICSLMRLPSQCLSPPRALRTADPHPTPASLRLRPPYLQGEALLQTLTKLLHILFWANK